MEDIVDRLRVLNFMGPWKEAADEIVKLRGVLLTVLEACEDVNSPDRKVREEITRTVRKALLAEAKVEIVRLREALREIYEVYAGSEGIPQPMTAAEGYLLSLLMQVVGIAQKALKEKE